MNFNEIENKALAYNERRTLNRIGRKFSADVSKRYNGWNIGTIIKADTGRVKRISKYNPRHNDHDPKDSNYAKAQIPLSRYSEKHNPNYLFEHSYQYSTEDEREKPISEFVGFNEIIDDPHIHKKCVECESDKMIYDPYRDEEYCGTCGLVHRQANKVMI